METNGTDKESFWSWEYWKQVIRLWIVHILEVIFALGGVTLTALIASGILLWGSIGLGVCATLGFVGISHFVGTRSWAYSYYAEEDKKFKSKLMLPESILNVMPCVKFLFLPIIFALGGIALIVLGSIGLIGSGLGIGLGISAVFAVFPALFQIIFGYIDSDKSLWLAYVSVMGMTVAATFGILNLAGILGLSAALAYGMPAAIVALAAMTIGPIIGSTAWIAVRTKMEELLEPILFFGGTTLTVLISIGILPFGALGIGICSMLTFIGASRFLATNSWSNDHNECYFGKNGARSLVKGSIFNGVVPIKFFISIIGVVAGIALPVLGAVGVFGLSLGLTAGIPILGASISGLVSTLLWASEYYQLYCSRKYRVRKSDNIWSVSTAIYGVVAASASLGLGFGGVLALPVAISIAAHSLGFSALIGLIHLAMFGLSKTNPDSFTGLKKIFTNGDENDPVVGFLGIGRYEYKKPESEEEEYKLV